VAKRKPGKYDHLLPKLKALPPGDPVRQAKIDFVKQDIRKCKTCDGTGTVRDDVESWPCTHCNNGRRKLTGSVLVDEYTQTRLQKEALEAAVAALGIELEACEQLLIASQQAGDPDWGAFGGSDRTVKMTDGDTLRVQPEVYAMVKDKAVFRHWCMQNNLANKMELPEKPTHDLMKIRLLNGQPEPPGTEAYVRTRIVFAPFKVKTEGETDTNNIEDDTQIF
jgi:ribosomal protein L37AE/L43A